MADPSNAGDRAKAYRLRKARAQLGPVDKLWLAEYEEKQQRASKASGGSKHYGRSRSARKINLQVEEAAEAEGEGNAAVAAASAALVAKEEGRRIDSLTINAVDAIKEACAVYKDVCLSMKERLEILESTHIEMLQSVRGYFLHAMHAEGDLMQQQQQQQGDPAKDMLVMLLAKHLGIPVAALGAAVEGQEMPPRTTPRPRPRPPANGVPK